MSILGRKRWRDIARQKAAFAAVAVTIALGVGGFVAAREAYLGLQTSFDKVYADERFADVVVTGGDVQSFARSASSLPGRPLVTERIQGDIPIRIGDHRLIGRMMGMPERGEPEVNRLEVRAGDLSGQGVYLEYHLADHFKLHPGDSIQLLTADGWRGISIAAIVISPEYLWPARSRQEVATDPEQFGVVFAPAGLTAGILGSRSVPQVAVHATERDQAAALKADARRLAATTKSEVMTRELQPSAEALQADVDSVGEYAVLFPIMFLTAAALGTYMLLSRLVLAQRTTIGTLLACGVAAGRLRRHYLGQGVVCGVTGSILGLALGSPLGGWFASEYGRALGLPYSLVGFYPEVLAIALILGILAAALAAWMPARSAARTSPAEAMRAAVPGGGGRISVFERIAPPLRRLPARWRMVLRGLGRNRRRSAFTIAGVVLAMGLVIVPLGLRDTISILVPRQFNQIERDDLQIYAAPGQVSTVLAGAQRDEAVSVSEPFARYDAVISSGGRDHQTLIVGYEPATVMHSFPEGLRSTGVVLPSSWKSSLGVSTGSTVTVAITALGVSEQVQVAAFVDEPMAAVAYSSLEQLDRWTGGTGTAATGVDVKFRPGADRHAAVTRLAALPGVAAVLDKAALQASLTGTFALYDSLVVLMAVIGAAMAVALLFNTVSAGMAERLVEFGSLQAAGMAARVIAAAVVAENLLLTALAIAPGLLVGWLLARAFMAAYQSDQFSLALQLQPQTLPLVAAGVLVCAALAQATTFRAIQRIDIASIVRERST